MSGPDTFEAKVDRLAQKLLRDGDPAAGDDEESARRAARRMLEDSEARTFDPATRDPEEDGVIRRSASETAASGDSGVTRWSHDGE